MTVRRWDGKYFIDAIWPDRRRTRRQTINKEQAKELDIRIRSSRIDGTWRELREMLYSHKSTNECPKCSAIRTETISLLKAAIQQLEDGAIDRALTSIVYAKKQAYRFIEEDHGLDCRGWASEDESTESGSGG